MQAWPLVWCCMKRQDSGEIYDRFAVAFPRIHEYWIQAVLPALRGEKRLILISTSNVRPNRFFDLSE
jgi:hypothetical protein